MPVPMKPFCPVAKSFQSHKHRNSLKDASVKAVDGISASSHGLSAGYATASRRDPQRGLSSSQSRLHDYLQVDQGFTGRIASGPQAETTAPASEQFGSVDSLDRYMERITGSDRVSESRRSNTTTTRNLTADLRMIGTQFAKQSDGRIEADVRSTLRTYAI